MILLANDDGIYSPNLWELARKLKTVSEVGIVAPTSQMSAVGTHLTLRAPIHVSEFPDQIKQSIPCYAVDGTPGDCIVVESLCIIFSLTSSGSRDPRHRNVI